MPNKVNFIFLILFLILILRKLHNLILQWAGHLIYFRKINAAASKVRRQQSRQGVARLAAGKGVNGFARLAQSNELEDVCIGTAANLELLAARLADPFHDHERCPALRCGDTLYQGLDHMVGIDTCGFGFEANDDAVPKHVMDHGLNIIGTDKILTQ